MGVHSRLFLWGVSAMGEHLPCKQEVMGSNPIRSSIWVGTVAASGADCKSVTQKHRRFESFPAHFRDRGVMAARLAWDQEARFESGDFD